MEHCKQIKLWQRKGNQQRKRHPNQEVDQRREAEEVVEDPVFAEVHLQVEDYQENIIRIWGYRSKCLIVNKLAEKWR
ncbi:MAG TPA: hypothetical protein DDW85_02350 [Porphyromonadaceae bacterium]|nr:hypothetical protein [Porphyromonadaceae bacterium]